MRIKDVIMGKGYDKKTEKMVYPNVDHKKHC